MTTVYHVGYRGWTMHELVRAVTDLDATLVDVRYNPHTRSFSRAQLQDAMRYVWLRELGNPLYRTGRVAIADLPAGLVKLRELMARGLVVVMCCCTELEECHRKVVLDALCDGADIEVVELARPDDGQMTMW